MKNRKLILSFLTCLSILINIPAVLCMTPAPIVYVAGDGSGDFNCSGTNDQIQINQALQFAAENSDYTTVHLKGPFTYTVNDTLLIGNNTTLEGDSTAVVKLADHAGWPKEKPLITQMGSSGQNITIMGFTIDGNREGNTDVTSGSDYYDLISLINCKNINVHDMYLTNNHGNGLKVKACSNISFHDNEAYLLGHDVLYALNSLQVEAHNNKITCRTNSGLRVYNTNNVSFYNNDITSKGSGGAGIEIQKYNDPVIEMNDIEIYNNTIYRTALAGIWIFGSGSYPPSSANVSVHHNQIYDTGTNSSNNKIGGIVSDGFNVLVENNVIDGAYGAGIAQKNVYYSETLNGMGYVVTARNNIITNTQRSSDGMNATGVINFLTGTHSFVLDNNCFYNNSGGDYWNVDPSTTDIQADPLYADRASHDYHLRSKAGRWSGSAWVSDSVNSPCIDAGHPLSDYSNEPEPNGDRINIGPDGNTAYASKSELSVPTPILPVANFSANVTSGYAPLTVRFNDISTGAPTSWEWDFGDGSSNSTEQNPGHTYNSAGTYTVVLSAYNEEGNSTSTKTNYITVAALGQAPGIEWQKCLGGSSFDYGTGVKQTSDGGYIVAGGSFSNDGNVTGNHGSQDSWVVKLDESGDVVWQKCLGGSLSDYGGSIEQTFDGGYIVAGFSNSNDGNVTGNHGSQDSWVVKLDESGDVVWQKCLGGSSSDYIHNIKQTSDSGYIAIGFSNSNDGNVTGNQGDKDSWVVKLDESGDVVWQKCLGGSLSDFGSSIKQTSDGGYIAAGGSYSNDGNVTGSHGSQDSWVVKLDESGDLMWQKCLGGSSSEAANGIEQTPDGGYIVSGYSNSDDGNVTGNHGSQDSWVVKLNESGDVVWQKCLGGSSIDYGNGIEQTSDGGYIIAGYSRSNDGNVTGNHGDNDSWVVKLDESGDLMWQKCLGGSSSDYVRNIEQTSDGGYIVAGHSNSNNGDVIGNNGNDDYWVVKLASQGPVADFSAIPTSGSAPLDVSFTDNSTDNPASWLWNFGDGANSVEQNPVHTYSTAGNYTVNLTVSNENGTDSKLATITVSDKPESVTEENITFTTTGSSFAPIINVTGSPTILWTFSDGTTSTSLRPNVSFGSSATRTHTLKVTPWSSLILIDLGYSGQDGGATPSDETIPSQTNQYVSSVTGLENVAPSLVKFAACGNPITSLNFSNFVELTTVECFYSGLTSINLTNTPKLDRLCVEDSDLSELNVTDSVILGDLRCAAQKHGLDSLILPSTITCWHLCCRDNTLTANVPLQNAPNLKELIIQNTNQSGELHPSSTKLTALYANNNSYTSVNISGCISSTYADNIRLQYNKIEHIDLTDCTGITGLQLQYNKLNQSEVDYVLHTLDGFANINGFVYLQGNTEPSSEGLSHANNLTGKNWIVILDSQSTVSIPVANFSTNVSEGYAPLIVQFNDLSENATSLSWDFNSDGISDSNESNPVYEFTTPGTYTVNLTVINEDGTDSASAIINALKLEPPVANFTANETEGFAPLVVQFSDTSSNSPTGWEWDFGDGNISADQNPAYTYSVPGNYTVNLTARNGDGPSNVKSMDIIVKRVPALPVANFNANETAGYVPLTVQFNDTSTNNPTGWEWNFGDGANSTVQNPEHTFSAEGNYTVTLVARNGDGPSDPKSMNITVNLVPTPPVANLTANETAGYAPLIVQFTDLSENADTVAWDFENDGIIDSNMSEPVYEYTAPGTYTVNLTAINANGTDSTSITINVSKKPEPLLPAADFSANVTSGYAPLTVRFNDTSTGAPTSWEWDFGDGSSNSTEQNPDHTYNSAGTYTVVLSAYNAEGNSTSKKINYITALNNNDTGSLTLVNADFSQSSSIPRGMYIETTDDSAPSNVTLSYNGTLKCADITYVKPVSGTLFFSNLYPATDSNITYTLGTEGVSGSSYVNIFASNSLVAVSKRANGGYRITSYWTADDKTTQGSSITIPADSIIDNKATFSVICYESNRTTLLKYNDQIYTKTPFRTINSRNQNYVFVSQPMVYFSPYLASGDTGPYVVHLYSIKQEIPRKIITPHGTRSISAFTLSHPDSENNGNGTDLMKSNGQKGTVYASVDHLDDDTVIYQKALLDEGWELGVYYTTNFNSVSNETAIATMDSEYNTIVNTFGRQPKTWTALGGSGNISQAVYAYQRYSMIWRTCESGASWLSVGNLCNTYWRWWNTSIEQGIVFPAFTIVTDKEPVTGSSINASYFKIFSDGFAANNIRLCGLSEYYFTQSAQNTTLVNITDSNDSYMRFTVNTGGYPCTLNVMTDMPNVEISHDGVTVPYASVDDGVVFTAANNTTYVVRALPPSPVANFTSNSTSGNVPLTVQFNDTSAGSPTSWNWDFGDGTHSSTQNTTHTFTTAGLYNVTLTVSRDESSSTITKTITVLEQPVFPVANFSTNVSEGYAPLSVQFSDSSENATSVSWDFNGDEVVDSGNRNPVFEFTIPGTYAVNLTAVNGNGTDSKSVEITVSEKPALAFPTANFSSNVSEGFAPLTVQFSDSSENATGWNWDFGDGANSAEQNPVHTYSAGNYTVNLTVSNENGTASKNATISVLKSTPAVTWSNPADITYGTPLSETQLNANASVPGNFAYNPVPGTILGAGTHTLEATFTPEDPTNYTTAAGSVSLTVNKAIPLITWSNPADITYGTSLNETQLNASASVSGTFAYTPDSGAVLSAGSHKLHVDFTPDDAVNYTSATANVTINVSELVPPVANFTADRKEGFAPLVVQFNDTSSNSPTEWSWEFGDGNISADQNPAYTYSVPGNYTVNLTARNGDGPSNVKSMDIIVKRVPTPPVANFTANETSGYAPLTVQFNDTSSNSPTGWEWDFGDGANSTVQNPEHTFSAEGNYTVTLVARNGDGSSDPKSMNITVNRVPALPVANFTANETSGYVPLTVQFTDLSENADTVAWDFNGDGIGDSGDRNPVHEFTVPGTHTVNLTASNGDGTDSTSASINVYEKPVLPVANFSSNVSEGFAPLTVQFSDSSENATGWYWDFGDGANSTEQNPVHTYSAPETYTVNLTASNENGTSSKIAQIAVTEVPVVADFTAYGMFMSAQFQDNSTGEPDTLEWDFGDGSENETGPWADYNNVTHPYTEAGTYNVTLTASKAGSSDTVTRQVTIRNYPNVSFTATPENGTAPLTVQFDDESDPEIDLLFWNFGYSGEGNTSDEENPMCTYTEPGNYTVELVGYNGTSTYHKTVTKNITVTGKSGTPVTAPVANFTFTPETGIIPCEIQFNDTSDTGGAELSYEWSFGNGIDNATTANTTCTFNSAGTYNVTLTVTNTAGSDSITRPVTVSMYNVSFTANLTNGTAPLTVQFNDTSDTEANTRYWYVNNDRLDIHDSDFVHTFVTPGVYTVKLEACNPDVAIWVTATKDITVTAPVAVPVMPETNFSCNVTEGYAPLTVQFNDSSENATGWHWDFGDGANSAEQNPVHTYSAAGTYIVNLTASNENGTASKLVTITASEKPEKLLPVVSFSVSITSGFAPLSVRFTDLSENADTVFWDFNNDGNIDSTERNPVHEYANPGAYTVNLTAGNKNGTDSRLATITVLKMPEPSASPVANFRSNVSKGYAPLTVQFTDYSENAVSWSWDFNNDGQIDSSYQNPVYLYAVPGVYTVKLTVANADGKSLKAATIKVLQQPEGPVLPEANFSINVSEGYAPLSVQFTDCSEYATSWSWDFDNDGQVDSTSKDPGYVYSAPGVYTVKLTVANKNGVDSISAIVRVSERSNAVLPVANFSSNVTEGYAPLTVQFTDSSENAAGVTWDFDDDGIVDSTSRSPVHVYSAPGTCRVNLTAVNENGSASKTATITVLKSSSSGGSGSGRSGSGGSSGAGGSPEPARNVEVKELSQAFIKGGESVRFDFSKSSTSILSITFDSKQTGGKTTTIVEMLKDKSKLTPETPEGEVYGYLNIRVGNSRLGTESNIENAVIHFRVEKSWIEENGIDQASIVLNRYNNSKWNPLPTSLSGEDDRYLYFTAETAGFSPFAITGKTTVTRTETKPETNVSEQNGENQGANTEQTPGQEGSTDASGKGSAVIPGFGAVYCITGLLAVFQYRKKRK